VIGSSLSSIKRKQYRSLRASKQRKREGAQGEGSKPQKVRKLKSQDPLLITKEVTEQEEGRLGKNKVPEEKG